VATRDDGVSARVTLLAIICDVFAERGLDRPLSAGWVEALVVVEGRSWAE
jgi:hypothetical protein